MVELRIGKKKENCVGGNSNSFSMRLPMNYKE